MAGTWETTGAKWVDDKGRRHSWTPQERAEASVALKMEALRAAARLEKALHSGGWNDYARRILADQANICRAVADHADNRSLDGWPSVSDGHGRIAEALSWLKQFEGE